jgi:peptide/nickel transport system permease protein
MPVFLWTDILIFLLVAVVVGFGFHARRQEHLRAPWREVARSRLGMASAVVLGTFVFVGLLDSIHFHPRMEVGDGKVGAPRYSSEVLSLFDLTVKPLRERVEKTYSAPFATHLYAKETVVLEDGRQVRDYPRLKYGGAHLKDPAQDWASDILGRAGMASLKALALWVLLAGAVILVLARRAQVSWGTLLSSVFGGRTQVPWKVLLLTVGAILWGVAMAVELSTHYHILGTDKVGQDVFYQTLKSIRTGLVIGTLTTLVMLPFAVLLGISAGYFGGWVDDIIQYIYTTLNSIPGVLLIAAAILMLQVYITTHAEGLESL